MSSHWEASHRSVASEESGKVRLVKSVENMALAEIAIDKGYHNGAASRLYYALYLMAVEYLESSPDPSRPPNGENRWRHGTITGPLNRKLGGSDVVCAVSSAESLRRKADYQPASVKRLEIDQIFPKAEKALAEMAGKLGVQV